MGTTPVSAANPLDKVSLEDGRHDENRVQGPVWETQGAPSVRFGEVTCTCQAGDPLVRRAKSGKPRYVIGSQLDLPGLLASALRAEAATLGLPTAADSSSSGPVVDVSIEHIELGEKRIPFGPLMYFTVLEVELRASGAPGVEPVHRLSLPNLAWQYNAGFGARDEASEALAMVIVEAAQEIVGYVATEIARLEPASTIAGTLAAIRAYGVEDREAEVRRIGLSGARALATELAALAASQDEEDERSEIFDALAMLRDASVVPELIRFYDGEDADARFFLLKALAAIGDAAAMQFLEGRGTGDPEAGCRQLAERAIAR
jgi:hypothetical protein